MIRVFLDANVLFAGTASLRGGSALILEGCRQGKFQAFVSRLVLLEAERNIRKKLPSKLNRFYRLLEAVPFQVVPPPSGEEVRVARAFINEKDAPISAAAVASRAAYLLTLDQKGFMTRTVRGAGLPLKILTPKEFLKVVLG